MYPDPAKVPKGASALDLRAMYLKQMRLIGMRPWVDDGAEELRSPVFTEHVST